MFQYTLENGKLQMTLREMIEGLEDPRPAMQEFYVHMVARIDNTFATAGAPGSVMTGGVDPQRGIVWKPLKSAYTRKDGTAVSAVGTTKRKDDLGKVRAKLRPSGTRVTPTSMLAQDTGRLRQRAASTVAITPASLLFGSDVAYAGQQNAIRDFLGMSTRDEDLLIDILYQHIMGD